MKLGEWYKVSWEFYLAQNSISKVHHWLAYNTLIQNITKRDKNYQFHIDKTCSICSPLLSDFIWKRKKTHVFEVAA